MAIARKVIGALLLLAAAAIAGMSVIMVGFSLEGVDGGGVPFWFFPAITLGPASVVILVGTLVFGRRWWRDTVGWTLVAAALYGLAVFLMTKIFMASPQALEMMEAIDPAGADAYGRLHQPAAGPLTVAGLLLLLGLPLAGWRFRARFGLGRGVSADPPLSALGDWATTSGRPLSVTIVAWFFVISSLVGAASQLVLLGPTGDATAAMVYDLWGISRGAAAGLGLGGGLVGLVSGIFLLRGRNWSRYALIFYMLTSTAVAAWLFRGGVVLVAPSLLVWIVAIVILFRPRASEYFTRKQEVGSNPS